MKKSLYDNIPAVLPDELVTVLAENGHVRIERIVSDGHVSPEDFRYDQEENEWIILLSGSAMLVFEDETVELDPGDYLLIPAHRKHCVASTSTTEKTVWLAVFF